MAGRAVTSLQTRNISRAAVSPMHAAARLELLEYYLIHTDDVARCAQASLEWLGRYAGIRKSVFLIVDSEAAALVGVAGYGISNDDVALFTSAMSDTRDPLVAALGERGPRVLR